MILGLARAGFRCGWTQGTTRADPFHPFCSALCCGGSILRPPWWPLGSTFLAWAWGPRSAAAQPRCWCLFKKKIQDSLIGPALVTCLFLNPSQRGGS